MAGQLVYHEARRGTPSLCRGWRTPDPSPTRACQGLPGCAGAGTWVEEPVVEHPVWQDLNRALVESTWHPRTPAPATPKLTVDLSARSLKPDWEGGISDNVSTPRFNVLSGFGQKTLVPTEEELANGEQSINAAEMKEWVSREQTPSPKWKCRADYGVAWEVAQLPPLPGAHEKEQPPEAWAAPPPRKSLGSAGHPLTCKGACKYVWKRRGCKDGSNCDRCHLCEWKRHEIRPGGRRHSSRRVSKDTDVAVTVVADEPLPGRFADTP